MLKPRLESAVLTRDDIKIWLNINLPLRRKAPKPLPSIAYFDADRRDAELMSEAVQLLRCPIWSKRFASPPGGRMLDQMTMAREWVGE